MAEYVRNIIIIGVAASLAVAALPKNAENVGRFVKQLSALLILAVVLSPLSKMSELIFAVKNGVDNFRTAVGGKTEDSGTDGTEEVICRYVVELLCKEYSFDRDATEVKLIFDGEEENSVIREIHIYTSEGNSAYFKAAEKYVEELFGVDAYVFGVGLEG